MSNREPCLCGDPECGRCFPRHYSRSERAERREDEQYERRRDERLAEQRERRERER